MNYIDIIVDSYTDTVDDIDISIDTDIRLFIAK